MLNFPAARRLVEVLELPHIAVAKKHPYIRICTGVLFLFPRARIGAYCGCDAPGEFTDPLYSTHGANPCGFSV